MGKKKYSNVVDLYSRPPLEGLNGKQKTYINMLKNRAISIALGFPGTGKTFIPAALATDWIQDSKNPIERLVIVRPPEGPGKSMGYLPGDLNEKLRVWAAPILAGVKYRLGGGAFADEKISNMIKMGQIVLLSLEHVRGLSLDNSVIILDEAENCTFHEIKAVMTRAGKDTKLVISGDVGQKDIRGASGLDTLARLTKEYEYVPWSVIEFEISDCVRSPLVKNLLELFDDAKV
jgi:phosphate starvation-inducible PhoH-like protein